MSTDKRDKYISMLQGAITIEKAEAAIIVEDLNSLALTVIENFLEMETKNGKKL